MVIASNKFKCVVSRGVAWSEQIIQMAGFVAKCGVALLSFVFIAFCSLLTLLNVVLVILRHPFQALKKTPRDGEDEHQIMNY